MLRREALPVVDPILSIALLLVLILQILELVMVVVTGVVVLVVMVEAVLVDIHLLVDMQVVTVYREVLQSMEAVAVVAGKELVALVLVIIIMVVAVAVAVLVYLVLVLVDQVGLLMEEEVGVEVAVQMELTVLHLPQVVVVITGVQEGVLNIMEPLVLMQGEQLELFGPAIHGNFRQLV